MITSILHFTCAQPSYITLETYNDLQQILNKKGDPYLFICTIKKTDKGQRCSNIKDLHLLKFFLWLKVFLEKSETVLFYRAVVLGAIGKNTKLVHSTMVYLTLFINKP